MHIRRGQYDQAIQDYGQALHLGPEARDYYGRGWCYMHKGDYESALRDFDEAIRLQPNSAEGYSGRAWVHFKRGRYDEAIQDCGQALRLSPNANAYFWRGWCYLKKGEYGRALPDFDQAIRVAPDAAASYSARGYVHIKRHEYDQAIRDYDHALRLRPDAKDDAMRRWAYYRKGDYFSTLPDFVQAAWRRSVILGRWIWTPLVLAAWLIYMVLRRQKAREAGLAAQDRLPVELVTVLETGDSFALNLAKASLEEAGIEYFVRGGDPLGLAESHGIFPNVPGCCQIQVARESESKARALLEALRNPSPIEDQAEEL
jgi:tetratricopeptide (TPR) repeat protein